MRQEQIGHVPREMAAARAQGNVVTAQGCKHAPDSRIYYKQVSSLQGAISGSQHPYSFNGDTSQPDILHKPHKRASPVLQGPSNPTDRTE